jgi:hypothetical protein
MGFSKEWYQDLLSREAAKAAAKNPSMIKPDDGLESELQEKVAAECQRRGWYFIRSRMDMPTTNAKGTPDFIIFPDRQKAFAVECKSGNKKLTKEQLGVMAWFHKLDQDYRVVRSEAEFIAIADDIQ